MDNKQMNPYSILFIEDEELIRTNYTNYLKRYFKAVYEAKDGQEGLDKYYKYKPDILIIDINIPKITGLELLKKIREKDHTTKALMLTAYSNNNLLLEVSGLKLTKYLIKPIKREELKSALSIVIDEIKRFETVSNNIISLKDDFIWNSDESRLFKDSLEVSLTLQEREILKFFFKKQNQKLSYDDIIYHIWENDYESNKLSSLKTAIKKLRKKLPTGIIENIYAVGYKFSI